MTNRIVYTQPDVCPNCGSKNIGMDHISYAGSLRETSDDWYCEDCSTHWMNIYTYSKTEVVEMTDI